MDLLSLQILLLNSISTLVMVGVIWVIQLVHYPLFYFVDNEKFIDFENQHTTRISYIVVPVMLIELATSIYLLIYSHEGINQLYVIAGFILLILIWVSTFLLQVPQHTILSQGFQQIAHNKLVLTNWIRTIAWSVRGLLIYFIWIEILQTLPLVP